MHRCTGVEHHIARLKLNALRAIGVFNHQLATVVLVRLSKEQRTRYIRSHMPPCGGMGSYRIINVVTEGVLGARVAVEQWRIDPLGQRAGQEEIIGRQRMQHNGACFFTVIAIFR